jgi:hypothetical protein
MPQYSIAANSRWKVESDTRPGHYHTITPRPNGQGLRCSCEDNAYRPERNCKHILYAFRAGWIVTITTATGTQYRPSVAYLRSLRPAPAPSSPPRDLSALTLSDLYGD